MASGVRWTEDGSGEADEGARGGERPATPRRLRSNLGQNDSRGGCKGKLLSPARRRACIDHVRSGLKLSERRVCRVLAQHRSTQRRVPAVPARRERSAPRVEAAEHAPSSIPISISAPPPRLVRCGPPVLSWRRREILVSTLSCPRLIQSLPSPTLFVVEVTEMDRNPKVRPQL